MASNGSFNTSNYDGAYLKFNWSVQSQSVANNTTTIYWELVGAGIDSGYWYMAAPFKVVINGQQVHYSSNRIRLYTGTVVASGTYTIGHNNDGTKSFSASAEAAIYSYAINVSGSGSWSLPTIARASQPSCITWPNTTNNIGTIGSTIYIHMNRKSDKFTHTVRYAFGSLSGTIATNVTNNCQWTIPDSFYTQIPNALRGVGTIYADTYNGNTLIGTKSVDFTTSADMNVASPVFNGNTFAWKETSDVIASIDGIYDSHKAVQFNSNMSFRFSQASGRKSATISKYELYLGQNVVATITPASATIVNDLIYKDVVPQFSGNLVSKVVVTDSRGLTAVLNLDVEILEYKTPAGLASAERESNFYNNTTLTVKPNISSLDGNNRATITYSYRKANDSSSIDGLLNGTSVVLNLDNRYNWIITVHINDLISTSSSGNTYTITLNVPIGIPLMFFDRKLQAVGINCFPEFDGQFKVNGDTLNETVLYNDSNGSNSSISLSETAANFKYLEIFYRTNDNYYGSVKIFEPNGKNAMLDGEYPYSYESTQLSSYAKRSVVSINGTSISPINYAEVTIICNTSGDNGKGHITHTNNVFITRVIGYRN